MPGPDRPATVTPADRLDIRRVRYDHPDAAALIALVQQEYVVRYGGHDGTPVAPDEFAPPLGEFLVGYAGGRALACGGWRAHESTDPGFGDGDAELKRMYVAPDARGLGHARALLAALEAGALAAGRVRMVLETGMKQPEAIALYRSSGYTEIAKFGTYRCEPTSRCFGRVLPG